MVIALQHSLLYFCNKKQPTCLKQKNNYTNKLIN